MRLISKAVAFAAEKHDGQTRKGTDIPYIVHPMEAGAIAGSITNDETIISAAVLHDVVEDCGVTIEEIEKSFGEAVAKLVSADSEDKREHLSAESTWKIRKQETLNDVEKMDYESKIVVLADKLSNLCAIYRDYSKIGDKLWQRFNCKEKSEHCWYYGSIANLLKSDLGDTIAWKEYDTLLDKVFN